MWSHNVNHVSNSGYGDCKLPPPLLVGSRGGYGIRDVDTALCLIEHETSAHVTSPSFEVSESRRNSKASRSQRWTESAKTLA